VRLRPHDRLLAREAPPHALCFFHQLRDLLPGLARLGGVDAADAVHGGRIEHVALAVADLVRRAGPRPSPPPPPRAPPGPRPPPPPAAPRTRASPPPPQNRPAASRPPAILS